MGRSRVKGKRLAAGIPNAPKEGRAARADHARDSSGRKEEMRARLRVAQLERALEKEENRLRNFREETEAEKGKPSAENKEAEKPKSRKRRRGEPDPTKWVLRGAARPWAEVAKLESGEMDAQAEPLGENLFETFSGRFGDNSHTTNFLRLQIEFASQCQAAGQIKKATAALERCLTLDVGDSLRARDALVALFLDEAQAAEAREVLERHPEDEGTFSSFSLAFIEFVAWKIVQEEDASEEIALSALKRAMARNPHVAPFIAAFELYRGAFDDLELEEGRRYRENSIEEGVRYMRMAGELWVETDGAEDFVRSALQSGEEDVHECAEGSRCSEDPAMEEAYRTFLEMVVAAEEEQGEDDEEE